MAVFPPSEMVVSAVSRIDLHYCVRVIAAASCFLLLSLFSLHAQNEVMRTFTIPAGDAENSFRQFSTQAGVQFIYSADKVRNVRTRAVTGDLTPRQAIDQLLEGTPLIAVYDNKTGALTVDRRSPEAPRTSAPPESRVADKKRIRRAAKTGTFAEMDQTIVLSPFEVTEQHDHSYQAASTLAANRLNTKLRDVGTAVSVVTEQMLQDIGATSNETLLQYTTNSEVGNIYGNMANAGSGQLLDETPRFVNPNANTRIRGLAAADNTLDFFLTDIPWDSYNVSRIDMQRGPNAILFGLGSPAGIINAGTRQAGYKTKGSVEVRFDRFGSVRTTLDYNLVLLPEELSVRADLLHNDEKFQQKPAYQDDRRAYGTFRYEPGFLNHSSAHTTFRGNYEVGRVRMSRPRTLPPADNLTQWFQTGVTHGFTATGAPRDYNNLNKMGFNQLGLQNGAVAALGDPSLGQQASALPDGSPNPHYQPWLGGQFAAQYFSNPMAIFDNAGSSNVRYFTPAILTPRGLNADGTIDGNIAGLPPNSTLSSITTYRDFARKTFLPGAMFGFTKNVFITDPSIFDFYNNLMDGPNKKEWQNFKRYSLNLDQTFLDGDAGIQASHDQQHYDNGQLVLLQDKAQGFFIDVMQTFADGSINPNFGRPFIADTVGQNHTTSSDRKADRLTAFLKHDFAKDRPSSLFSRILGTQTFTGFFNSETRKTDFRTFQRYGTDLSYKDIIALNTSTLNFSDPQRVPFPVIYLGPSLINQSSAAGAKIPRPADEVVLKSGSIHVFDSTWAAPSGVNPGDPWTNTFYPVGNVLRTSTQSENPSNYRGWVNIPFNVMDSEQGNRDALTSQAMLNKLTVESQSLVYNGAFFDGALVGMYGWRHDIAKNYSYGTSRLPDGGPANLDPSVFKLPARYNDRIDAQSRTWSVVGHLTEFFPHNPLPFELSLFYNQSQNFAANPGRVGAYGENLGPPTGNTKDVGVMIATKDGNYSLRVNKYTSVLHNATSTAGANSFYLLQLFTDFQPLKNVYKYKIDGNVFDFSGTRGNDPTRWTWAPRQGQTVDQAAAEESASIGEWEKMLAQLPPAFLSAYRIDPNFVGRLTQAGAPAGFNLTEDSVSKGYEVEVFASPLPNLRLTANASKSEAIRTNQGEASFLNVINIIGDALNNTAAGLMRFDATAGSVNALNSWNNNFNAQWQAVKQQEGGLVPELRKWRFNAVANYEFKHGLLSGINVGTSYRWQDKVIIGWATKYIDAVGNPAENPQVAKAGLFDFSKPYWGPTESNVDLWIGYTRKLKHNLVFRTQLNVSNVGKGNYLIPITTQPDGTVAGARIAPTQVWRLSNTIEF